MKSVIRREPDGHPARLIPVTNYYQRLRVTPIQEKFTGSNRNTGWREITPNIDALFANLIRVLQFFHGVVLIFAGRR
ncbi:hypothetical protein ACQRKX_004882 [Enterobacter cloacae]